MVDVDDMWRLDMTRQLGKDSPAEVSAIAVRMENLERNQKQLQRIKNRTSCVNVISDNYLSHKFR